MPEVLRGGQGYSTISPQKGDIIIRRRSRGGGSSKRRTQSVSVIGGTVKIDGVGYSVAPSLQEKFIRDRTGGRGSSAQTAIKAAAERAAAVVAATKAAELKRIETAKSFTEKTRIAKEIVMSRQARSEFQRMLNFRSNLIKKGVTEDKRMSTNQAGEKLEVSQWRDKFGNRIERIKNLKQNTTTYSTFKKRGSRVIKTGGVSMGSIGTTKEAASVLARKVKITNSPDYPGRKVVIFPSGKTGTINASGRVTVGKASAGANYVFQDGKIISIDGRDTTGRVEYVPVATVEGIGIKPIERKITTLEKKAGLTQKDINKGFNIERFGLTDADVKAGLTIQSGGGIVPVDADDILNLAFISSGIGFGKFAIKKIAGLPKYLRLFKNTALIRSSGVGGLTRQIKTLVDLKQGQLAQAYLKAKNAQLGDKTIGSFVTMGGSPSKNVLEELNKKLRTININPKDITLSRYAQSFKVPSNIPKTEAIIKMLKTGRTFTQKQLRAIKKYYDFKREGVLVTKVLPNGNVKVVAMEYNRIGNKISHISYKVGVGSDTFAVVDTFKKIRKLSTIKGIRVKHTGSAVVKSKIIKQEQLTNDIKKTVSQLKTKKVFLNGKRLDRKEIKFFEDMLKAQNQDVMSKKLGSIISKLYKKSPDYNISSIANVIRVKRTLNKILFKSGKKKGRSIGAAKKGEFLEIGFIKKRLASDRKLKLIRKAKISPAAARRVIKLKPAEKKAMIKIDNTIKVISKGVSKSTQGLVKLEIKKGATNIQVRNVENAVKSIQTIIRPVLKSSKPTITKSKVVLIKSNVKKMLPVLSASSKTSLVNLTRSLTALQKIDRLVKTPVQKAATKTITKKVLKSFSALKTTTVRVFKRSPITPKPTPIPRPYIIPRLKPKTVPKPIPFPWKIDKTKTRKLGKKIMGYSFVIKTGNKSSRMRLPPLTLKDALNVGAKYLDNRLKRSGEVVPTGMVNVVARLPSNTVNYYNKNKKKIRTVRIRKGKALTLQRTIIEKNKYISDTKGEKLALKKERAKRKPSKRKPTKRKISRKKLPTLSNLKTTKQRLLSKRKRMVNKLKNS